MSLVRTCASAAVHRANSRAALAFVLTGLLIMVPIDHLFPRSIDQDRLFPRLIRGAMLAVLVIYNADTFARTRLRFLPMLCRAFLLLSLLIGVHVTLSALHDFGCLSRYAIHLFWVMGLVFFYYVGVTGSLDEQLMSRFVCGAVALAVLFNVLQVVSVRSDSDMAQANGYAYPLLWLLPLLLALRRNRLRIPLIVCSVVAVAFTLKRGAIFAMSLCWVAHALFLPADGQSNRRLKAAALALSMGLVGMAVVSSQRELVQRRIQDLRSWDSAGSGRGHIYGVLWRRWSDGDIATKLFGFGYQAIPRLCRDRLSVEYAHSDWLAVLHDYGALGALALGVVHVCWILTIRRALHTNAEEASPLALLYIVFFCVNVYSGQLDYASLMYMSLPLGYLLGQMETRCRAGMHVH